MAILSKEEFTNRIKTRIGEGQTDDDISFLEDMADTYNDLESKAKVDQEDWKTKYDELDKSWRQKYTDRFFNFSDTDSSTPITPNSSDNDNEEDNSPKTFTELFTDQK